MTDRPNAAPSDSYWTMLETDIGQCGLAWSPAGLTRVQLPESNSAATEVRLQRHARLRWEGPLPDNMTTCATKLLRYCSGEREDFVGVVLDMSALSKFDARMYELLRSVGWGTTITYGALAARAGAPGAARAVGAAMSTNPWPVIVPCHRVLPATGQVGGFSAYGGSETKHALLELEGVRLREPSLWDF
jgi:methylated-DNA-[protein]-cysteine S-methyltransferase